MERIKIGNGIAVTWRIDMRSAAGQTELEKGSLSLYLRCDYMAYAISDFSLQDNVISFIFPAALQQYTGVYSIILIEDSDGTRRVCEDEAFELVSHTPLERGAQTSPDAYGNYPVELETNVLTVRSVANDAALYARVVALETAAGSLRSDVTDIQAYVTANSHSSAYDEDYLEVTDFAACDCVKELTGSERGAAVIGMLNVWLDNVKFELSTQQKYMGRCKLHADGVDIECYNFVKDWASNAGSQMVFGSVDLSDEGKVIIRGTFRILVREYSGGAWGRWEQYGTDFEEITPEQVDEIWDRL